MSDREFDWPEEMPSDFFQSDLLGMGFSTPTGHELIVDHTKSIAKFFWRGLEDLGHFSARVSKRAAYTALRTHILEQRKRDEGLVKQGMEESCMCLKCGYCGECWQGPCPNCKPEEEPVKVESLSVSDYVRVNTHLVWGATRSQEAFKVLADHIDTLHAEVAELRGRLGE